MDTICQTVAVLKENHANPTAKEIHKENVSAWMGLPIMDNIVQGAPKAKFGSKNSNAALQLAELIKLSTPPQRNASVRSATEYMRESAIIVPLRFSYWTDTAQPAR